MAQDLTSFLDPTKRGGIFPFCFFVRLGHIAAPAFRLRIQHGYCHCLLTFGNVAATARRDKVMFTRILAVEPFEPRLYACKTASLEAVALIDDSVLAFKLSDDNRIDQTIRGDVSCERGVSCRRAGQAQEAQLERSVMKIRAIPRRVWADLTLPTVRPFRQRSSARRSRAPASRHFPPQLEVERSRRGLILEAPRRSPPG